MKTDQLRRQTAVAYLSGRFWTKVNRRLDNRLVLIVDKRVSDEDAPMEIWHVNADSWRNKKQLFFSWHLHVLRWHHCQRGRRMQHKDDLDE